MRGYVSRGWNKSTIGFLQSLGDPLPDKWSDWEYGDIDTLYSYLKGLNDWIGDNPLGLTLEELDELSRYLRSKAAEYARPHKQYNIDLPDAFLQANYICSREMILPHSGIYISNRFRKHLCTAPAAKMLHVIETNDIDWCEKLIHRRFNYCRRVSNHEHFDLDRYDLALLFSCDRVDNPDITSVYQLALW